MKIKIAKIVRSLSLASYAPEYGDTVFEVWVNPPSALTDEVNSTIQATNKAFETLKVSEDEAEILAARETIEAQSLAQARLFAELWSQGRTETRMSVDDIKSLAEETVDTDPMLYAWLIGETWKMVLEHRHLTKKK